MRGLKKWWSEGYGSAGSVGRKRLLSFSLFFLISICFWLFVSFQTTYRTTVQVPVLLSGVPQTIAIEGAIPTHLAVEVEETGWTLMAYYLNNYAHSLELPFEADTTDSSASKEYVWTPDALSNELIKYFSLGRRAAEPKILSVHPSSISYRYSSKAMREIPVRVMTKVVPVASYVVQSVLPEYDKVVAYGTKSRLDTIRYIPTDTITLTGINASTTIRVPLIEPEGISLRTRTVNLKITTEQLMQRDFMVKLYVPPATDGYQVRLFPSEVKVMCVVPASAEALLSPLDFVAAVNLDTVSNSKKGQLEVLLKQYPDFVQLVQVEPATVDYIIEKP